MFTRARFRWVAKKVYVLIEIREERPDDVAAVRDLNRRAFGQDQESNIVDALRANGAALLSLVAIVNDRVVGHIMTVRYLSVATLRVRHWARWQYSPNANAKESGVN